MLTRLQPFRRVSATAAPRRMFRTSVAADARVLCSDPINAVAVDILQRRGHDVTTPAANKPLTPEELKLAIPEFDALVVRSGTTVTPEVLEHAERLKFIGRAGTGVNNIDIPAATSRGVVVMNTPGGNTTSAVELTISLMFALARHIPQAATLLKDGVWDRASFKGSELAGKTIGIVGLGLIGREVAAICQKFEMRTVAYDPVMSPDVAARSGIQLMPLKSLFLEADFLTVHTPLNEATKDLIDAHALNSCKTGVKVINTARGGIINEQALLDALKSGQVSGAALDVFTTEPPTNPAALELIDHPNVICTPHLGASTKDAQFRVAKDIAEYLADALDGVKYSGVVNASGLEMQSNEKLRPWVELADRIGLLEAGLLSTSRISQVSIAIRGPTISDPKIAQVLRRAVLRGIMDKISNVPVNLVNAPTLVENIGLQVLSSVQTEPDFDHRNVIAVTLTSIDGESVSFSGTLIRGEPTLVRFHNHDINIHPDGRMLLVRNEDRPGVVYRVSQLLGSDLVNVNEMSLALHEQEAFSVYNIDNKVSTDMLERLRAIPGVRAVQESFVESTFSKAKESIPKAPVKVAVALADQRPPATRPSNPCFGSGPTTKRPGWSLDALSGAALGRSHRSSLGKGKLAEAIDRTKDILNVPSDYHVGIVPASDTGAFEMAMWTMLGQQPVDVAHWESFGKGWYTDATTHLQLDDVHEYSAPYGELPEMPSNPDHDVLFTWNGTTSGVRVPNADWLATGSGKGLAFCDATSAVFAQQVPLDKLDVVTYSWQKVLGGEGAHGMLILSPKAVDRLESYVPPRPLPKIFRLAKKGKLDAAIFKGSTINTPSMLCVEDYLDSLKWAEELGGLDVLCRRADRNLAVVESFVGDREWISFLAADPATRSNTSVCLTVDLPDDKLKLMLQLLDTAGVAYDIGAYRDAPAGLRIWCGATVREQDLAQLMPWLEWAYHQALTA